MKVGNSNPFTQEQSGSHQHRLSFLLHLTVSVLDFRKQILYFSHVLYAFFTMSCLFSGLQSLSSVHDPFLQSTPLLRSKIWLVGPKLLGINTIFREEQRKENQNFFISTNAKKMPERSTLLSTGLFQLQVARIPKTSHLSPLSFLLKGSYLLTNFEYNPPILSYYQLFVLAPT